MGKLKAPNKNKKNSAVPKHGFIYKISNLITKQCYIGLTLRVVHERWASHRYSAGADAAVGSLAHAIFNHGPSNFKVVTIGKFPAHKLPQIERKLIEKHKTLAPLGYNRHPGGQMPDGFGTQTIVRRKKFKSLSAAARHFGVDPGIAKQRIASGWTLDEALGLKLKEDLFGPREIIVGRRKFRSIQVAAKQFGLLPGTVVNRLSLGWSPEEALGLKPPPVRVAHNGKKIVVSGIEYPSIRIAAKAVGVDPERARERLSYGWSVDEAFGIVTHKKVHHREVMVDGYSFESLVQAANHFGILYSTVMHRLRKKWSIEQALGVTPPPFIKKSHKKIQVGERVFLSISEAAIYFKVAPSLAIKRLGMGWSAEEALNLVSRKNQHAQPVTIFGKSYSGIVEALAAHKIALQTAMTRVTKSKSLEQAIEEIVNSRGVIFREKRYDSYKNLAIAHDVNPVTFHGRLSRGWSVEEALGVAARTRSKWNARKVLVNGKRFPSILEAARYFKIDSKVVFQRLRLGWSVQDAIVTPLMKTKHNSIPVRIKRKTYTSIAAAARAHKADLGLVQKRISKGWLPEKAILTPKLKRGGYRRK